MKKQFLLPYMHFNGKTIGTVIDANSGNRIPRKNSYLFNRLLNGY